MRRLAKKQLAASATAAAFDSVRGTLDLIDVLDKKINLIMRMVQKLDRRITALEQSEKAPGIREDRHDRF